jgi:LysR family transcriptional regulator, regulator of abg operon
MRLLQIRNFLAVVDTGSFRAAARQLGLSQPTITKSIHALEDGLHTQLAQRTQRGVVLTPAGRTFLARARVAYSELRKAEEELAHSGADNAGTVAFGVGPVAALLIAPQTVARFHEQFPRACVRVVEGFPSALLPLVRDGSLDFTVGARLESKLDPALTSRPLYREEFAVVARKGHPLRHARSLAELANADWISFWPGDLPAGPLAKAFSSAGLPLPRQSVQCESFTTVVAVVAKTDMLTMTSRRMLASPVVREYLQEIRIAEPAPSLTVAMYSRADGPPTKLGAALAKGIATAARDLTGLKGARVASD